MNDFNQPELDLYVCLEDTEAETWHWLHPLYFSVANTRTLFGDQRTLPKYFERLPCLTVSSFGADDASPVPTSHTAPYQIPTACTMPYRCLKVERLDRWISPPHYHRGSIVMFFRFALLLLLLPAAFADLPFYCRCCKFTFTI